MAKSTPRIESGSALAALEATIRDSGEVRALVRVRLPRRKDPLEVRLLVGDRTAHVSARGKSTKTLKLPIIIDGGRDAAMSLVRDLANRLTRGKVELESGVAYGADCGADDATLARQFVAAWCEGLGNDVPSDSELREIQEQRKREVDQLFTQFLEDLRSRPPARESNTFTAEDAAECQGWRQRVDALRLASHAGFADPLTHRPSLAGADLRGANLTGLSLCLFDMSNCRLRGAHVRGDFSHVDFSGADLRETRFSRATLAHAKFIDADLSGSRLDGANLLGARFVRTSLKKVNVRGANCDRATFEDVSWDKAEFDEKTRWPVGFQIPPELIWAGAGEDPRASQPKKPRRRRTPKRLTADLLLSDEQLAERAVGIEHDPKLPDYVDVDAPDDSVLGRELRFTILLEFLPHRLADLGLSQKEIDFNTWYRCERFARLHDAIEGGIAAGHHDRADQWFDNACSDMDEAEFWKLYKRIEREVQKMSAG